MDSFFLIVNFDCYVLKVDTRIDLCIICNIVIYLLRLVRLRDLRNDNIDIPCMFLFDKNRLSMNTLPLYNTFNKYWNQKDRFISTKKDPGAA